MRNVIILLLIPTLFTAQLSDKINDLYKKMSKSERVESEFISFSMEESKVYKLFSQMSENASDSELQYMGYNGNAVVKTYVSYITFSRKSKLLENIFEYYLKNNIPVDIKQGCTGYSSHIADELYKYIFNEKDIIKRGVEYKKYKDSILSIKGPEPSLLYLLNQIDEVNEKHEIVWTEKEVDSILVKFEQLVLNDESSPQYLVEIIAEANYQSKEKRAYSQKLIYFNRKYNSEFIKKYLEFCNK